MGVITLEIGKEDGILEMPMVASQVAVGVCGAHVFGGRVLVVVVADFVREFERIFADAAIFDLPILVLFLRRKDGESFWQEYL
jgi:hypothetical protein